jgi:hypothetical protein
MGETTPRLTEEIIRVLAEAGRPLLASEIANKVRVEGQPSKTKVEINRRLFGPMASLVARDDHFRWALKNGLEAREAMAAAHIATVSAWRSGIGRIHFGAKPGAVALCGRAVPKAARDVMADILADWVPAEVCAGCRKAIGGEGPWFAPDGWVRPPRSIEVHVGGGTKAWMLNELTWQRAVKLSKFQRLSRAAVVQIGTTARVAANDPARQHVFQALGGNLLQNWAAMVKLGWAPPATPDAEADMDIADSWLLVWILCNDGDDPQGVGLGSGNRPGR